MVEVTLNPYDPNRQKNFDNIILDLKNIGAKEDYSLFGVRSVPIDMKLGLDYLHIEYTKYAPKMTNVFLEAKIVENGARHIRGLPFIKDLLKMGHFMRSDPIIKKSKRYRADYNLTIKFEYLQPYYTKSPRNHGITSDAAKNLGNLSHWTHLDYTYLYCIAELYGQIFFMDSLEKQPDQECYDANKLETDHFEEQLIEEIDHSKIRYRLYELQQDRKLLKSFKDLNINIDDYIHELTDEEIEQEEAYKQDNEGY
jgi:hypothetical protein